MVQRVGQGLPAVGAIAALGRGQTDCTSQLLEKSLIRSCPNYRRNRGRGGEGMAQGCRLRPIPYLQGQAIGLNFDCHYAWR